ncbi:uncharacterized protein LOC124166096 [Ischnura elegans]|uniref:uncharacterized protein LOC124166096 n=1 Tax=Ischnura elegans TaxID=197161 RepID=UPI001ED8B8FD|nr:uncharacterized protein LOC124166096 [Ischnura elegans]
MVRIGEYSPNFRGNRPIAEGSSGIIFGEYEEKRKHYVEQRKLEYKQYLAQKASNVNYPNETKSTSLLPSQEHSVSTSSADSSATKVPKDVATQTLGREQKDASTNTDRNSYLDPVGNYPSGQCSEQRNGREGLSSRANEEDDRNHRLTKIQGSSDENFRPHSIGVSRGRALWDKNIGRNLAERHSLQGDAREEFSSLLKEKDDCNDRPLHSVGVGCGQNLWEESRESNLAGKLSIQQDAREELSSLLTEKDDHHSRHLHPIAVPCGQDLWKESGDRSPAIKVANNEKSLDFSYAKESRSKSERFCREEKNIEPLEDKKSSTTSVLSQLGEVRRQLATKQIEMEEALKKSR